MVGTVKIELPLNLRDRKIERDRHAGISQLILGCTIRHGASHNHSSDAQRLQLGLSTPPILGIPRQQHFRSDQLLLED
jgi:hypothetical protein